MHEALVTVCIATYNHEHYINRCLESVFSQKTLFEFKVILGDDASTDNTQSLIRNFSRKFPKKINPIFREQNLGSPLNGLDIWQKTNSKYVAILDGDDYWTDPHKLQKQVDYLEANPSVTCCATRFDELNKEGVFVRHSQKHANEIQVLSTKEIIMRGHSPTQTCTLVFRKSLIDPIPKFLFNKKLVPGDWALTLWFSLKGKVVILPFCSAIYRMHNQGTWTNREYLTKILNILNFYSIMIIYVPFKYYLAILFSFYNNMKYYLDFTFHLKSFKKIFSKITNLLKVPLTIFFIPIILYQLLFYFWGRIKLLKLT